MVRELKHMEIGDIPVDWKLQTFDETFRVISNNTLSRENLNNRGGAVRNIHYGDILTKFPEVLDCNEEEIPYVNELSLLSSSTQLLQDGDIVVADTAEDETVGKVIEVQNLGDSKLVAGLHTIPCRVKKGDFAPGWLGYYMNSDLFHNQILPYITGIKVSSISKGAISKTLILVPPFDEQEKIVQSLNKIQLLMTAETKVVNKIKLVKNGCLSKMFPQKDDTVPKMRLPGFTEAWEQRKLGEYVEITSGEAPAKFQEGDINYVKVDDLNYAYKTVINTQNKVLKNSSVKMVQAGSVIFPKRGAAILTNKVRVLGVDSYMDTNMMALSSEKLDTNFLYTMLSKEGLYKIADTSTIPQINNKHIEPYKIYLPSMDEQLKIGIYFSNLDNLITLHQCKCKSCKKYYKCTRKLK